MKATLAQRFEYYSLRGVIRALAALDWETACRIGEALGATGYEPLRIRKHVVEKQIAAAFPDMTQGQVHAIARASFAHLGRTAIETALLPALGRQGLLELVKKVDGWEHVERATAGGRATVQAAKTNFARDYAAVVALGKAIPSSVDMPSLLVQLEQAARGTGIKFDGITMGERTAPEAPAATGGAAPAPGGTASAPPAGTAPSGQPPQSAPGQAAASAQGAADAASAPPPGGTSGTPATPGDPAATGAAAPTAAGALESVTLEFGFTGSFFELADLFHRLKRFVYMNGDKVRVKGRLMTIDSVSYQTSPETFPTLSATVHATVFLSPKAEGVTAGATPTGPAPAAAGAAPVSTASGDSSSPTPTATATP